MKKTTTLALLLAAPLAAQTAQPAPSPEPQMQRTETVVVTASRVEANASDAPATLSVVDAETIATAPSQTWADLLRSVPGTNVIQMSARDFNVTSRQATGTIAATQLALVDGRTVYLDFFGVILWDTVPLQPSEVKQIEVVRGPASAVWGANALTGVVNIITKTPRESLGTRLALQGGLFGRDAGSGIGRGAGHNFGANLVLSRAPSETWSYKLSAGYSESEAFARPTGTIPVIPDPRTPGAFVGGAAYPLDGPGLPGQAFENAGSKQPKLDLRVDQELGDSGRLSYNAGYAGSAGIIHSGIGPFQTDDDSYFAYGRAAWTKGALKVAGFVNAMHAKAPSLLAVDPLSGQAVRLDFDTKTWDLEASHARPLGSRHLLSYGANVRRNQFEISLAPDGENRTEVGAYLQDEFFVDRFRLSAGARLDKFGNLDGVAFSPRVSALWKATPQHALRASFNQAFRAPSVVENHLRQAIVTPVDLSPLAAFLPPPLRPAVAAPFPLVVFAVGNEELEKTEMRSLELGYTGTFGATTVSASIYRNDTDENVNFATLPASADPYTAAAPPPGWVERGLPPQLVSLLALQGAFLPRTAFQYLNFGPLRHEGVELSVEHRFGPAWSAAANYSWQGEPDVLDSSTPFPREELALPPTHRFNLQASWDGGRAFGTATLNHASRAFWSDVLTPEYHGYSDAYTLVNLALGLRLRDERATLVLRATNLLDQTIQQHVFGDLMKRSVTAELQLSF